MTPRVAVGLLLSTILACGFFGQGHAQVRDWDDIDCVGSRLAIPAGLKCRATQEYQVGQVNAKGSGKGTMRRWSASGRVNGIKFFYYLFEVTSVGTGTGDSRSLVEAIIDSSPQGRGAEDFSPLTKRSGVDFVTFTGGAGERCVGIRKYGPSSKTGFKWLLNATRCAPKGRPASDPEIDKFISEANPRS